jgi:hypothetical protein
VHTHFLSLSLSLSLSLLCIMCAKLHDVILWVIFIKKCCINIYPISTVTSLRALYCFKTLHSISSYELRTHLALSLTNTTPSFLVLILVHRFGLQGHQFSQPLTAPSGAHEGRCLLAKTTSRQELLQWIMESANHIRGNYQKSNQFSLWASELCTQNTGGHFEQ